MSFPSVAEENIQLAAKFTIFSRLFIDDLQRNSPVESKSIRGVKNAVCYQNPLKVHHTMDGN